MLAAAMCGLFYATVWSVAFTMTIINNMNRGWQFPWWGIKQLVIQAVR